MIDQSANVHSRAPAHGCDFTNPPHRQASKKLANAKKRCQPPFLRIEKGG
jgi:hypothetical protein